MTADFQNPALVRDATAVVLPKPARRVPQGLFNRVLTFIALVVATAMFIFPFLWLLSNSLKNRNQVFSGDWIPDPIAWGNYVRIWEAVPFLTWSWNSLLTGVLAAATVTISSALVAFAFAQMRFPFRNQIFGLVLATMMLPGAVTMVPNFIIWDRLGLANSLTPLWAGNLFGSAFYIFLLRQFFLSLPRELFEAARVDGASYLQQWWKIAMPLTRPALIVVFVFEFRASWTDLVKPLIYLKDTLQFTLPRGLKSVLDRFGRGGESEWEIVLAASVLVALPMIAIFFAAQRYFIEGIATTGSKG